jgi:hypothetical protein
LVIPAKPQDFTANWLQSALASQLAESNARVRDVKAVYHETPGQTADTILLTLQYGGETTLPDRMFCKVNTRNADTLEIVKSMDLYRREVAFYNQVDDVGLPVPACYYGAFDPASYQFVLLLEDLSEGICPSWGISESQARDAIALLPSFHARWWNSPEARRFDWAIQLDETRYWSNWRADTPVNLERAIAKLGKALTDDFITTVSLALDKWDALLAYLATRPFSLVHGDYHFKQIFFPRDDGVGRLAVFDWQFPYVAPGPWDLARVMGATLPSQTRRNLQSEILTAYLDGLAHGGVTGYDIDGLHEDLATGSLINLLIHTNAFGATDLSILEREATAYGADMRQVLIDQMVDLALDFDTAGLLRGL